MEMSRGAFGDDFVGASASASKENLWPPGFRFHPTDEELILYYLKRKICRRPLKLNMIGDTDVYKCEPWELPGKSLLQTGDKQWFFFSPRDRKYPNGVRSNRGTKCGYWKATGKDRTISRNSRAVGMKKTLVFHKGRAPKGERTDWVMHEYTIDKEELKNYNTVQDSYALYKIYQKSGPGPKNGAQYGAPFREEEWFDEDILDDRLGNLSGENLLPPLELTGAIGQCPSVNSVDIDEVLQQMADDLNQQHVNSLSYVSEVDGEVGMRNSVVEPWLREATSVEISEVWQPRENVEDVQTSFQNANSANSLLQSPEAPEVLSLPHWLEQEPHRTDGDFMELNDLVDPKAGISSLESISNQCPFLDNDGLYHLDLYFDAPIFLPEEIVPPEGTASQPYFDSFSGDTAGYHLPTSFDDENQYLAEHVTSQLWTHEHVISSTESRQVVLAPSASGAVYDGSLVTTSEGTHKQGGSKGDASEPWFTSAINSLLESIPTNPASASENALISRAFERMSSFGAVRVGTGETGVVPDMGTAVRREGRNGGFLFISCLGVLWAILWLLMIGTMVKVFKSFCGRFIAS